MRNALFRCAPAALVCLTPALARAETRAVVDPPASRDAAAKGVTVFVLNDDEAPAPIDAPPTLSARAADGTLLTLVPDGAPSATSVAAHGFVRLRYRLADAALVAEPAPSGQLLSAAPPAAKPLPDEQTITTGRGSSSGFLDRLYAYEPIYGVWGPGTTGAKLQFSFAARPIGGDGALSHLRFAYTQQVFWRVNDLSGPVRSNTYSPELFFELPATPSTTVALGYRHDSNGGGVSDSVDLNRFYVKLTKSVALGDGWRLTLTPMVWYNAFHHGIATDIDDYWGYAAITTSIEQHNGVKLSVYARGNPATGKGASEIFLSYPIRRFGVGDVGLYLFGQLYSGYGEQLIDYNRDYTRARIGISFTR